MSDLLTDRSRAEDAPRPGPPRSAHLTSRIADSNPKRRWWRDALRRRLLAIADLTAAALATLAVVVPVMGNFWALALLPLWPLTAKLLGLYDRDHRALRHLTADEVPAILAWVACVTALTALILSLTSSSAPGGEAIVWLFVCAAAFAIGLRALTRWAWWRRTPPELVGLVGDDPVLASLRRKFKVFREMHLELVAECRIADLDDGPRRTQQLRELADGVDRIVVAASGLEADLIGELKGLCHRRQVKLSVVSPLRGRALPSEGFSRLADLPILEYNTWDRSRSTFIIKRLFDLLLAVIGLVLISPFLVAIAIAIKLDSPGPVFFSQIRAGIGGRPFRMYKLRTMNVDAEANLEGLVDLVGLEEPVFKLTDDPRVTRVGRVLRRFSIDEVPQLINVLVGEMSIVGPRPEQVELVARYSPAQRAKLEIKPGVTGPMQVFGRGELNFSERLAVELEYVENASLGRDLQILIHTPSAVMRGTGAF